MQIKAIAIAASITCVSLFSVGTSVAADVGDGSNASMDCQHMDWKTVESQLPTETKVDLSQNPQLTAGFKARMVALCQLVQSGKHDKAGVSMLGASFMTWVVSNQDAYHHDPSGTDCTAELASSALAASDALSSINGYNQKHYKVGEVVPEKYDAKTIMAGVLQSTMSLSSSAITANQMAIGTFKVCNASSQKALSYITTITNLQTTMFSTFFR